MFQLFYTIKLTNSLFWLFILRLLDEYEKKSKHLNFYFEVLLQCRSTLTEWIFYLNGLTLDFNERVRLQILPNVAEYITFAHVNSLAIASHLRSV